MTNIGDKVSPYWKIYNETLNGKRTISQALKYLSDNYTGRTRKAIRHQMEELNRYTVVAEQTLLGYLKDAIKLGYPDDMNFERAFR